MLSCYPQVCLFLKDSPILRKMSFERLNGCVTGFIFSLKIFLPSYFVESTEICLDIYLLSSIGEEEFPEVLLFARITFKLGFEPLRECSRLFFEKPQISSQHSPCRVVMCSMGLLPMDLRKKLTENMSSPVVYFFWKQVFGQLAFMLQILFFGLLKNCQETL